MKFKNLSYLLLMLTMSLSALNFSGCGEKVALSEHYSDNMKKLLLCYNVYLNAHSFTGPKNEEVFKEYLKTDPNAIFRLKRIDMTPDDIDAIFLSERDGEPFVIRYGLRGLNDHAFIFEKTGIDGKRMVALSDPIEVDADLYDKYLSGKVKAAGPTEDFQDDDDVADADAALAESDAEATPAE